MHRVVVTGLGVITPLGLDIETFWSRLLNGESGIDRISSFDPSDLEVQIAAEVKGFDPKDFMDFKAARRMDRFAQFAVAAAGQAIQDAGLAITPENAQRIGVMLNTGGGGIHSMVREVLNFYQRGPSRVSPFFVPMFAPNMGACQISIVYGITGPIMASVAACAAGTQAFVDALRMLRLGEIDVMIAGGTEAGLEPVAVTAFANMGALSRRNDQPQKASRPFDRDRDGFVFGEGCAVMVLETEEHARRRDARIYCELIGGAVTGDAFHISAPAPNGAGAARAMELALADARTRPDEIDYICAHGTSTPLNDVSETVAIKTTFGEHAYRVAISSPKSMIGHLVGAAGAVSGVVCALAIRDNIVPPTINLENPDPECDLDYVPNVARRMRVNAAIANAFGFGGQNAVAVFRRYED
ncbi:beta-ketoacyl-ACP synthase II [Thermomicrobiaceae bacterium CFH 74404]|uniref:3-oxoacyl-[acyl-carrier-protein] synthase 2 n=1 Tax=Thermalbibacter longus TaxID=2951981 RepID=A0AA41WCF9_9BACT|nr:beta-ketoacyl-ACP synthase II [Thermalbibacter longus]MCM8750297.1 beta-ketoacyl-ACP synthase II [Thermalbibacter longus]